MLPAGQGDNTFSPGTVFFKENDETYLSGLFKKAKINSKLKNSLQRI
jgi:hypothetical protein